MTHAWESMEEFDSFRNLVIAHKKEVMAILYQESARLWAECHVATAKIDGEIERCRAEKTILEAMIEHASLYEAKKEALKSANELVSPEPEC